MIELVIRVFIYYLVCHEGVFCGFVDLNDFFFSNILINLLIYLRVKQRVVGIG